MNDDVQTPSRNSKYEKIRTPKLIPSTLSWFTETAAACEDVCGWRIVNVADPVGDGVNKLRLAVPLESCPQISDALVLIEGSVSFSSPAVIETGIAEI